MISASRFFRSSSESFTPFFSAAAAKSVFIMNCCASCSRKYFFACSSCSAGIGCRVMICVTSASSSPYVSFLPLTSTATFLGSTGATLAISSAVAGAGGWDIPCGGMPGTAVSAFAAAASLPCSPAVAGLTFLPQPATTTAATATAPIRPIFILISFFVKNRSMIQKDS